MNKETKQVKTCPEGKYLNPLTNRCKKIESSTALAACKEGYERNPQTNRCRKISSSSSSLTPCKEGYERNPETNRCRKVAVNNGADYAVAPIDENQRDDPQAFIAMIGIIALALIAVVFLIVQYRKEIKNFIIGIFQKCFILKR